MSHHRRSICYILVIKTSDDTFVVIVWVLAAIPGTFGGGVFISKDLCLWRWAEREGALHPCYFGSRKGPSSSENCYRASLAGFMILVNRDFVNVYGTRFPSRLRNSLKSAHTAPR